jgi:hypothetical protein
MSTFSMWRNTAVLVRLERHGQHRHTAVHALLKGLTGSRSVPGNMKMHTVVTK